MKWKWLFDLLKAKGVDESEVNATVTKISTEFERVTGETEQLKTTIQDRDKQLSDLKKNVGNNEALKKQIEQLQADNTKNTEQYQAHLKDIQITSAIKLAISKEVHDVDVLSNLLDKSKIELNEDGTIKAGLNDQMKALRESKAFLFVPEQDQNVMFKGVTPGDGKGSQTFKNPFSKEFFNLTEQGRLFKESPEQAQQLQQLVQQ